MKIETLFPLSPNLAIAYYQLGALSPLNLVQLSDQWLCESIFTDSINILQTHKDPKMYEVSDLFEKAMEELNVAIPTRIESAWIVAEDILQRMVAGSIDLMDGANFLYNDVHHEIDEELPDGKYLGSNLGFEHIFCWLREIWDCRDGSTLFYYTDLPRNEAEIKFQQHLMEEAVKWLDSRRAHLKS